MTAKARAAIHSVYRCSPQKFRDKFYLAFLIVFFECLCFKGAATFDVALVVVILAPFAGTAAGEDFANAGDDTATAASTTKDAITLFMIGSPSVFEMI